MNYTALLLTLSYAGLAQSMNYTEQPASIRTIQRDFKAIQRDLINHAAFLEEAPQRPFGSIVARSAAELLLTQDITLAGHDVTTSLSELEKVSEEEWQAKLLEAAGAQIQEEARKSLEFIKNSILYEPLARRVFRDAASRGIQKRTLHDCLADFSETPAKFKSCIDYVIAQDVEVSTLFIFHLGRMAIAEQHKAGIRLDPDKEADQDDEDYAVTTALARDMLSIAVLGEMMKTVLYKKFAQETTDSPATHAHLVDATLRRLRKFSLQLTKRDIHEL